MDNITAKIKSYLAEHNLLNKKIIVAFSGGYDSMCLLDVLNKLGVKLAAAHLNHNWRGKESLADEKLCEKFCKDNNIEFYSETLSDDVEKTETAARKARYEFLERTAAKLKAQCVFTAHNADDNAETVLYRIIKGSGTYGLEGIKEHRGIFYRPMLNIYREKIEEYCKLNNLSPCYDSSNDNTKYNRNLIRHKILPVMENINRDVKNALNSLSQIARDENTMLDELLPDLNNLRTGDFLQYNPPFQKRIIHKFLRQTGIDYDREKIELILEFITSNHSTKSGITMSLSTNLWLFVNASHICTIQKSSKSCTVTPIPCCGHYPIDDGIFSIEQFTMMPTKFPADELYMAYVDLSKIKFPLTFRHRQEGDYIYPFGAGGKQKIKKYLNNKKIPQYEKDNLVFLCSGQEVLWAAGLGISEKIKVENKPTHMLMLIKK